MDIIRVSDTEESKNCSISELISFLKSAFRPTDFENVERMLRLREEKMKLEKEALEVEMRSMEKLKLKEIAKHAVEMEEELEVYQSKCSELSVELEKKKKECVAIEDKYGQVEFRKIAVEDELKEHKRMCDGLKEQITRLEEYGKVVCEREGRALERITNLSEELKKMESHEREKYVQLKIENRDLECGKRRAESEIEVWKRRFRELETRVLWLEEETSVLRGIEVESDGLPNEVSDEEEEKKDRSKTSKIQSETNDVADPPPIDMLHKPLVDVKEEKRSDSSEFEVEYGSRVSKRLEFELEGSSSEKMAPPKPTIVRPTSVGVIEISDSDDEIEITPKHTFNMRGNKIAHDSIVHDLGGALDCEKETTSQKCLKRVCSDRRDEENGSSREENIPLTSTPKRKRTSKIVTSDSETEDDDDKIQIGKLKSKKLQEIVDGFRRPLGSPVNQCSVAPTVSYGGENVEESITPSRRRLIPLRLWEEKKFGAEITSPNHLEMSGNSYQKAGNPTAKNAQENEPEEVGSDSEGESLGGFIVNESDGSDSEDKSTDSEDAGDVDLAFNQVLSMIRRNRDTKSKYQYEADMLSSFEEDPELCMKAVCALYRQQTSEEKSMKGSLHSNNRGFNKFDALRGTTLAEFLMDGDREGDLKKSVKELEVYDPKALEECKRLARHYSKQLFKIYQNKEDPFFLPL